VHQEFSQGFAEYTEKYPSLMLLSWSGCTQLSKDSKIPAIGHIKQFVVKWHKNENMPAGT
jgi:hypothetical protein